MRTPRYDNGQNASGGFLELPLEQEDDIKQFSQFLGRVKAPTILRRMSQSHYNSAAGSIELWDNAAFCIKSLEATISVNSLLTAETTSSKYCQLDVPRF